LIFRISDDERVERGCKLGDTVILCKMLEKADADATHGSTGVYASMPYMVLSIALHGHPTIQSCQANRKISESLSGRVLYGGGCESFRAACRKRSQRAKALPWCGNISTAALWY